MKLKNIEIINIASLKGEHFIDFEDISKTSNLFAITGDTGSGKSSILSSISLALYGKNVKNVTQMDLVTLGAPFGSVKLEFSVNGKNYQSYWYTRQRKKSGEELKNPKASRELYEINHDGSKTILTKTIEEVLHLSFEQFTKTIILNQGEFANFLLANFTERKEILEKFYNIGMLSKISVLAKQDADLKKIQITEQEKKIEGLKEASSINLEASNQKLGELLRELENKNLLFKPYTHFLDQLKNIFINIRAIEANSTRIESTALKLKDKLTSSNSLKENFSKEKQIFEEFKEKNEKLLPKLLIAIKIDKDLEHIKNNINQSNIELASFRSKLSDIKKEASGIKDKISANSTQKSLLGFDEFKDYSHLKKVLEDIQEFKKILNSFSNINTQQENFKIELKKIEELGIELKKNLEEMKLFVEMNDKESLFFEKEKIDKDFKIFLEYQTENEAQLKRKLNFEKKSNDTLKELKVLEEKKEILNVDLNKEISQHKLVLNSIELYELKKSIIKCLHESKETGVCVVCQSPIKNDLKTNVNDDLLNIDKLLKEEADIKTNLNKLDLELKDLAFTEKSLEKNLHTENNEIQAKEEELKNKFKNLPHTIKSEQQYLERKEAIIKLLQKLEDYSSEIKNIASKLEKSRIDYLGYKEKITKNNVDLDILLQKKEELSKMLPPNIDFNNLDLEEQRYKSAIALQYDYEKYVIEEKNVASKMEELNNQTFKKEENLKNLHKQFEDLKIQRFAVTEILNPEETQKKLQEDAKRQEAIVQKFQEELKEIDDEIKNLEVSKRQSLEQRENLHIQMELDLALGIKLLEESHDSYLMAIKEKLKVGVELNSTYFELILKETEQKKISHEESIEETKLSISKLTTLIEEHKKSEQKQELILLEIEKLKAEHARFEVLYQLVGRDEFRNFILSKIESELIFQTNHELKELCDSRYEIVHEFKNDRNAPEFYIIDKLSDGRLRKISTLSGGETFMVSLAQALALAELSRGSADIGSFFIDEGFGTLDEDSLEDVIRMLTNLQGKGKQIGIISHVKKLTDRIPINLVLIKNKLGSSQIELKYN